MNAQTPTMTIWQVCDLVQLSKGTIYNKMRRQEFPLPGNFGGRKRFWRRSDIENWIENGIEAPSVPE